MKISVKQYAQSLYESVIGKSDKEASEVIIKFAAMLRSRYELGRLKEIISAFNEIWNSENKELQAELTTARPLTAASHDLIIKYLEERTGAKKIELAENVNKNIIGGFILKYGSKVLDGSLKSSLEGLKNKISN